MRLWMGFILVAVLPLLGLSLVCLAAFESALTDTVLSRIASIADKKAVQVDAYMTERLNDAVELTARSSIRSTLDNRHKAGQSPGTAVIDPSVARKLAQHVNSSGYTDLLLIDGTGTVVFSVKRELDLGTNLLHGPFRQTALSRAYRVSISLRQPQTTRFQRYQPSADQFASFVVAPVLDGERAIGAVALQLNYESLSSVARDRTGLGNTGETVLGQLEEDEVVYMTGLVRAPAAQGTAVPSALAAWPMREALEGRQGQGRVQDYSGAEVLAAWRYLPSLGWGMTVKLDEEEALQPVIRLRRLTFLVLCGFFLLAALAAHLLGRSLSRPLHLLTAAARRIAGGDLSRRALVRPMFGELRVLAQAFNRMAASVEESQTRLQLRVSDQSEELAQSYRRLQLDLDHRKKTEERLRSYASVFEHSGDAIVLTDSANRIIDANSAFTRLTGYTLAEVRGKNPRVLRSGQTPPAVYEELWARLRERGFWVGEIWDRRKDGSVYPKLMSVSVVRDDEGVVANYIARFTDISERKAVEARMEQLAHYDTLTGLLNRFSLQQELERAVAHAKTEGSALSLVFLDLDRFKAVNDALGHAVGDELLLRVGQRIRNCVREQDIVARPGGDEFVIVLAATEPGTAARRVAEKLLESLRQPYNIQGHRIHTTPSLGIAGYPADGSSAEELMRSADTAMYYAKSQGRDNAQFFTAELNQAWIERMNLERELRRAIEADELVLYYQPLLDLRTGTISRVEALLRWPHPQLGFVSPARFIPIAEDCGLIALLGARVLQKACAELTGWRQRGLIEVSVAVNLSAHELRSPEIVTRVTGALEQAGLQPHWLEVEVTESAAMSDPARTIEHLNALRRLGVGIAIDDFGTGHSSLSYLKLLPATTLKLDRSLVHDVETHGTDLAICHATIALAHTLGLAAVAEGVESDTQKQLLAERGCDLLQGYHICKPLPAEEVFDFIVRWNQGPVAIGGAGAVVEAGVAA